MRGITKEVRAVLTEGPATVAEIAVELHLDTDTVKASVAYLQRQQCAHSCGVVENRDPYGPPHGARRWLKLYELSRRRK
jgi:hypothetical protein